MRFGQIGEGGLRISRRREANTFSPPTSAATSLTLNAEPRPTLSARPSAMADFIAARSACTTSLTWVKSRVCEPSP